MLTLDEEASNKDIDSGRIIVENYFGRLCILWYILSSKYKWMEGFYDNIFMFCLALTNIHVRNNPFRQEDFDFYQLYKNRLYTFGE